MHKINSKMLYALTCILTKIPQYLHMVLQPRHFGRVLRFGANSPILEGRMATRTAPITTTRTEQRLRAILDDAVCKDIELGISSRPKLWRHRRSRAPWSIVHIYMLHWLLCTCMARYTVGLYVCVLNCSYFLLPSTCYLRWDRGQAPYLGHCQVGVLSALPKRALQAHDYLFHARAFRRLSILYPVPEYAHLKRVRNQDNGERTIK